MLNELNSIYNEFFRGIIEEREGWKDKQGISEEALQSKWEDMESVDAERVVRVELSYIGIVETAYRNNREYYKFHSEPMRTITDGEYKPLTYFIVNKDEVHRRIHEYYDSGCQK